MKNMKMLELDMVFEKIFTILKLDSFFVKFWLGNYFVFKLKEKSDGSKLMKFVNIA